MSNLRFLTNDEVLRHLEQVRRQSPVIGELCRRLEEASTPPQVDALLCPVCQAGLLAEYCEFDGTIELKVNP